MFNWDPVLRGTPQGSALASLLFLIYINNMPLQIQHGSLLQYANDTYLICCRSTQFVILPPIYVGDHSLECVDTQTQSIWTGIKITNLAGEVVLPAYVRRWLTTQLYLIGYH